MNNQQIAADAEMRVHTLAKQGDAAFILSTALLTTVLRTADLEDVEALASGDEDAYSAFVDRLDLGTFVHEHTIDSFDDVARMILDERTDNAKSAWEVETELRVLQGVA